MENDDFAQWHKKIYGWNLEDADYAKFKGEFRIRRCAWDAGRLAERKECALLAQSFQIAHCKSHYDDAVDSTANQIKEVILDRG